MRYETRDIYGKLKANEQMRPNSQLMRLEKRLQIQGKNPPQLKIFFPWQIMFATLSIKRIFLPDPYYLLVNERFYHTSRTSIEFDRIRKQNEIVRSETPHPPFSTKFFSVSISWERQGQQQTNPPLPPAKKNGGGGGGNTFAWSSSTSAFRRKEGGGEIPNSIILVCSTFYSAYDASYSTTTELDTRHVQLLIL